MRQLQSLVTPDSMLEVAIVDVERPTPRPHEVLVRVDATPINPSDLGLLLAGADLSTVEASGTDTHPKLTAQIPPAVFATLAGRVGQSMPVGNESAGVVVEAGDSDEAQALLGATVAVLGGAMYAEYRCVPVASALRLPDDTDPRDGASMFVNPLTALAMTETMQREGHTALVHTAAASNLGQMLNKICIADGISLVNIVRRPCQVDLLRSIGAAYVVDSSADSFTDDLVAALTETNATIAFDAIGGGPLAGQILAAMEAAAVANAEGYSRYGSTTHKQVYIYGGLDRGPTLLTRTFGMSWSVGGYLLTNFMNEVGPEVANRLRQRVVDEMHTTFASHYTDELTLGETLDPDRVSAYAKQATGEKVLIRPNA
ncbi:MAG: zinc-binding dehydrogenase [Acidimicrobiales bacterium]